MLVGGILKIVIVNWSDYSCAITSCQCNTMQESCAIVQIVALYSHCHKCCGCSLTVFQGYF